MNFAEHFSKLEKHSSMNLGQLSDIVLESEFELLENDVNANDVLVFFGEKGKPLYTNISVKLRRNPEYNTYILVFELG